MLFRSQMTGGQGILAISHDFTENVVYTTQDVTYTVTTDTGVKSVQAVVEYIPASAYGSSETNPTKFEPKPCEKNGTTFTFTTKFNQCGLYHVNFIPTALDGTVMEGKLTENDVFSVKPENERSVYEYNFETYNLSEDPLMRRGSYTIQYSSSLIVLGNAGNKMLYVMDSTVPNGSVKGFIEEKVVKSEINPIVKRGYILLFKSVHDTEGWESLNEGAYNQALELYRTVGCNLPIYSDRCVDPVELDRTFRNMQQADFNDKSYIFLFCHHDNTHGFELIRGSTDYDNDFMSDEELALYIKPIKGHVILTLCACESGSFIDLIEQESNSQVYLDREHHTIITGSGSDESAYGEIEIQHSVYFNPIVGDVTFSQNENGTQMSRALLNLVREQSALSKNGEIRLSQLRDQIPELQTGYYFAGAYFHESDWYKTSPYEYIRDLFYLEYSATPRYYGLDETIVFEY